MKALGRSIVWAWDHSLGFVLKWLLLALIRIYQLTLSKLFMPSCRFHPSCSAYALGCVYEHGALKGTALSVWRLVRCNPWNGGGLDPVPEHGYWRPAILSDGRPRVDASHEHRN